MTDTIDRVMTADGADVYRYWRAKLQGMDVEIVTTGIGGVLGDPQPGLWRARPAKNVPFEGVRIWLADDDGQPVHKFRAGLTLWAERGNSKPFSGDDVLRLWSYCISNPTTKADFDYWKANGIWPGEIEAPASIGDNSKNFGVGFEGLKAELDSYAETCTSFLTMLAKKGGAETKAEADQLSNMADAIGDVKGGIARKIDEARDELVRPHIEAQKAINQQYKPLVDLGKDVATKLRNVSGVWVEKERARLRAVAQEAAEAERKRLQAIRDKENADRQAAYEAEQKRIAEIAAQVGEDAPQIEMAPEPEPLPDIVVPVAEVKIQVGGQRGAKRSLKADKVARITNIDLVFGAFKENPKVVELLEKLAQAVVKAGGTVPGVQVDEVSKL